MDWREIMGVGAAVAGAAVVGGVASVYGSNQAASAQESAANQASQTQQGMFNVANQNLQPFIQTGTQAAGEIANLEGLNGGNSASIQSTLQGLPGYQFANTQGLKSVQNSATARGLGISGAAQKGAAAYSTGLANQYYNNLLTGLQNTENTGAGAAGTLTGAATATGSQIGQNIVGAGNASAVNSIAQGNAVGSVANSGANAYLTSSLLNNFQNPASSGYLSNSNGYALQNGNQADVNLNLGQIGQ
jgi:hypothetical protein